jgi:DNA polymerase-3 subunit alpha
MDETRRMGIEVLGPDLNESDVKFTVNKDGNIRFGLGAIKGMGEIATLQLIGEREKNGFFESVYDLVERVNLTALNKKSLEAMAVAGAFDSFPQTSRAQYFSSDAKGASFIENLIRYGNSAKEVKSSSQNSLWGDTGGFEIVKPEPAQCPDWAKLEMLNKEKEVIGIYLSAHPLDDFKFEINTFTTASLADIQNLKAYFERDVVVAGMVTEIRDGTTKNGKPWGSFTIQDYSDSFRFMLFDKDFVDNRKFCVVGYYLLINGRVQKKSYNDELEFRIKKITLLSSVKDELVKSVTLKIDPAIINGEFIKELKELTDENKGGTELKFQFVSAEDKISLPMFSRTCRVRMNNELISFLDDSPGIEYVVK